MEGGREVEDGAGWGEGKAGGGDWSELAARRKVQRGGDDGRRTDEWRASLSPMRWPITVGARSNALQVERTVF